MTDDTDAKYMSDINDRLDRLESVVEQQQATIEDQQSTIEQQRERIAELNGDGSDDTPLLANRRNALKTGGLLALLFGGVGTASADPHGVVGTSNDPLQAVYTEEVNGGVTGGTAVTDLLGNGLGLSSGALTVDLNAVGSGTGVLTGVSDNGIDYRSLSGGDGVSVTESGGTITVGATDTTVTTDTSHETVRLLDSTTAERGADVTSKSMSYKAGLKINPNGAMDSIDVKISSSTSGASTVYLTDTDLNTLATTSFPGSDSWATLNYSLSGGTSYYVLVDNDGSDYTIGYSGSANYPVESAGVDITTMVTNGGYESTALTPRAIRAVRSAPLSSATRHVSFSDPTPVSRWETATFQDEQDGETVAVYVETDDGSGWSDWQTDPIGPGTNLSAIPPDSRVRFRVELSRSNSVNDPRVTLVSRQYRP